MRLSTRITFQAQVLSHLSSLESKSGKLAGSSSGAAMSSGVVPLSFLCELFEEFLLYLTNQGPSPGAKGLSLTLAQTFHLPSTKIQDLQAWVATVS